MLMMIGRMNLETNRFSGREKSTSGMIFPSVSLDLLLVLATCVQLFGSILYCLLSIIVVLGAPILATKKSNIYFI